MGVVSLGSRVVSVVESPNQCPSGTWVSPAPAPTGSSRMLYYCNSGEPWYCEWFGIGCKGVAPVQPPSPQSQEQMSDPSQWTPDTVSEQWKAQQEENLRIWLESTSGIASAMPGEKTMDALKIAGISAGTLIAAGAALALLILLKR